MIRYKKEKDRVISNKGKEQFSIERDNDNGNKIISTNIKELASGINEEGSEFEVESVKIEEMEDLPLYDFVIEWKKKMAAKKHIDEKK